MSKREELLAVLLVMCATGWALEYYHSQTSIELAALRQAVNEANISTQSRYTTLTATDFASISASGPNLITGMVQRDLGTLAQSYDTHKEQTP